ncbi:hypothetical protein ILUMI_07787 [Ignelater luminosus]|uniref:Ileal sodium/bile acid cotransporter n=1 Tax=Ignelater luminosus TaxID=2038154 RepID=A0A8K0D5R1_IGNLU|nr:hypothetical protein ILUMI_07787 [Ignelater luminosus]
MCPLSAMMQFFVILVSLLLLCHHVVAQWTLNVKNDNANITMYETEILEYDIAGPNTSDLQLRLSTESEHIADVDRTEIIIKSEELNKGFKGNFSITGNFLGHTTVSLKLFKKNPSELLAEKFIDVKVTRAKRVIDTVFTSSVATLVSIIYINFGCALNWGELRTGLKRPVGPVIGIVGQFLIMPLLSFGLGKVLFPDNPEMQLGMFFTGVSPGGGASNVWVAVLDGNIDLSITMTAISTFGAFGMMPLWLFTLGRVIFEQGNLQVPYREISTYAIALVVPLLIGYLIQRFFKKVAAFFVRILKGFSSLLILFIIIFAIATNLYLFELFSWQIVVAGMGLPWLGYMLAYLLARICRQSAKNSLTIAIETGIQNTGISIFLLRFALPQPEADLTTVVPVAVATMTPFPLMFLFIYLKLRSRFSPQKEKTHLLSGSTPNEIDLDNNINDVDINKNGNRDIATIS